MGRIKEINYFRAAAALRIVVPLIWVVSLRFGLILWVCPTRSLCSLFRPLSLNMLDVKVLSIQLTLAIVCYQ